MSETTYQRTQKVINEVREFFHWNIYPFKHPDFINMIAAQIDRIEESLKNDYVTEAWINNESNPGNSIEQGGYYWPLWKFFNDEHNLMLLDSDIQEIIHQVEMLIQKKVKQTPDLSKYEVERDQFKTTFRFYAADGGFVGAYKTGSLTKGEPVILFNLDFLCENLAEEDQKLEGFKDVMLQTITHEFCHAMQEWLGKEFDEYEVEKVIGAINERWNVLSGEQTEDDEWIDEQVFKISDFLEWMNESKAKTFDEFKEEVNELFKPVRLWIEAHKKANSEQSPEECDATEAQSRHSTMAQKNIITPEKEEKK